MLYIFYKRQMKAYVAPEWSQIDDALEKLDLEYGGSKSGGGVSGNNECGRTEQNEDENQEDSKSNDDESNDSFDEESDDLFCVACEKSFKSAKSFQNHEKSKKHRENVELLKKHMKDEDASFFAVNETTPELDNTTSKTK